MPHISHSKQRGAFKSTRSFLRLWRRPKQSTPLKQKSGIKVAFIHNEKKISTGAHHINELMANALKAKGVRVRTFYPRLQLSDTPLHLRGIANILFFHSLLEHKNEILKHGIIQGTTYTTLPFLTFNVPTVSHFGSTTKGFLESVPKTGELPQIERKIWRELYGLDIVPDLDIKTTRPLRDIADIEKLVATRVTACVAASQKVKAELLRMKVEESKIRVVHNAIEDYWFETTPPEVANPPQLVFLGRLGNDVFTLKLKGLSRLIWFYRAFPDTPKTTICMTTNRKLKDWLRVSFPNHYMFTNLRKDFIPGALRPLYGSILFLPSRYEGFSLSLIEGMSQGLVPISYSVGVAPEIIRDGENGYIVSSRDEAVARAQELLENTPRRLAMAAAAREATQSFRSEKIAKEFLTLYQSMRSKPDTKE